eukprot:6214174-Pleurochrysis_carterae.AAC.5
MYAGALVVSDALVVRRASPLEWTQYRTCIHACTRMPTQSADPYRPVRALPVSCASTPRTGTSARHAQSGHKRTVYDRLTACVALLAY